MGAADSAALGFCTVAYPWTLVAAKLKCIRETLENLKASLTKGAPPKILSYEKVVTDLDLTSTGDSSSDIRMNMKPLARWLIVFNMEMLS